MNLSNIESIVSRYRKHVRVGMKLYYTDAAGGECYEVTEVTDDILTVKDSAGNGADLLFDSLQIGWEFSEADREHIRLITEPRVDSDFWKNYYIQERIDAVAAERPEWFTGNVNDY